MTDFQVPLIEDDKLAVSPKRASEEAFYAASSKGGADAAVNYNQARADLQQTGQSPFIEYEKDQWKKEQEIANKETILGIINDPTVSSDLKRNILKGYEVTGVLPTSLKDKYVQKIAAVEQGTTIDDKESQDANIEVLGERLKENNSSYINSNILSGSKTLFDIISSGAAHSTVGMDTATYGKATASVASSILASIPAGVAGLFSAIATQDLAKSASLISDIQQTLTYTPEDKKSQAVVKLIMEAAEAVSIPAKAIGDFVNTAKFTVTPEMLEKRKRLGQPEMSDNIETSALAATFAEIASDPLNLIGVKGVSALRKVPLETGIIARMTSPKVPVDSPLEITNVANPKVAERMAIATLNEPTGMAAEAMGVNKGDIIHDWVMPKIFPEDLAKTHPDLHAKLIADMKAVDTVQQANFINTRYDPNIMNATKREAEVDQIMQITRESNSPYYIQSKSLINETEGLFEGNAVYGRNSTSGYTREKDAQEAFKNLKESIDQLPEELRGTLSLVKHKKQYFINHQWKKEYDELDRLTFSADSIQTSVLGMNANWLATSAAGRWLFPTGRFPKWLENASLNSVETGAKLKADTTRIIREKILTSPHREELNYVINEAEELGKDYYSPQDLGSMFPKLNTKEIEELFTAHSYWRKVQLYNYNFLNREVRNRLLSRNMEGLYSKDGTYIGAGSTKVSEAEIAGINEIWDFDLGAPVAFNPTKIADKSRQVVRLDTPISGEGSKYNYGLTGLDANVNLLPREVLQRIPGYSGRRVAESFYVDVLPKKLKIDGKTISDPKGLLDYVETKAAARTLHEGNKIAEQLKDKYPDHTIVVRPERADKFGRVLTDFQIHQETLKHSMKRGERLPSLNGPARLEDRLVTLMNTSSATSRMAASSQWEETFKSAFVKGFSQFLDKGQFPEFIGQIKNVRKDADSINQHRAALAMFKHFERIKNTDTVVDFYYTTGLHNIADVLEKWKLPGHQMLGGKHENPLMLAKKAATVSYIYLNVPRQWFIQTAQQWEMAAMNPKGAAKNWANTLAIRAYLGAESATLKSVKGITQEAFRKQGELAGNKDFLADVQAIKESGMLDSVDMNSIVHGVFRDTNRALVESTPEKIAAVGKEIGTFLPRGAKAIGFDFAELTNRVGNWLHTKDMWIEKNPGKDWKTREAKAEIAAEATKLSGAMSRAALLPYQEGMLSIPFQFAAISHKMLMNIIQDNTTILNGPQRARLALARMGLFGAKYGIPGGTILYNLIEQSDDEEVKANAELVKRGFVDWASNRAIAAFVEPNEAPDLAVSKIMTPYSEGFLPYFTVLNEAYKLIDDKPAGPRYPAIGIAGAFKDSIEDMHGWWITRDINESNYKQAFMEAAEIASGFNNYTQGLLMLGMRDKVTKMGNKYGMEFTASEAYAKMTLGISSQKEEDLWKLVELDQDTAKQKKDMAKVFYQQINNQIRKRGLDGNEEEYATRVRMTNNFINLLDPNHFSPQDKIDVINEVAKLNEKNYKTIKESILVENFKHYQEKATKNRQQVQDILNRSTDPQIQKYNEALRKGNP